MLLYKYISIHYKSILFAFIIAFLSLYPFESNQTSSIFDIPHMDKIVHFILYAFLAFLIYTEIPGGMDIKKYFRIVLLCLIIGGTIEIIQVFLEKRSGDVYDLLANFAGSLFAIPAYILFKKLKL